MIKIRTANQEVQPEFASTGNAGRDAKTVEMDHTTLGAPSRDVPPTFAAVECVQSMVVEGDASTKAVLNRHVERLGTA